jgi:hypothetical protein
MRAMRAGLRMDGQGVTVRNFWRRYKISWSEVSHLSDGSVVMGDAGRIWALGVVLRDGRRRRVSTVLMLSEAELEALREAAVRYGVRAERTGPRGARMNGDRPDGRGLFEDPGGMAGLRYWDGSAWSPLLPVSAGTGWPVWKSNAAWTALPVAPHPWVPPGIEEARAARGSGSASAPSPLRRCRPPRWSRRSGRATGSGRFEARAARASSDADFSAHHWVG